MSHQFFRRTIAAFFIFLSLPAFANNLDITQGQAKKLVQSEILFTMKGSNTIGEKLAPALAEKYLLELGATETDIIKTHPVEKTVVGTMPSGNIQAVSIKAHGH